MKQYYIALKGTGVISRRTTAKSRLPQSWKVQQAWKPGSQYYWWGSGSCHNSKYKVWWIAIGRIWDWHGALWNVIHFIPFIIRDCCSFLRQISDAAPLQTQCPLYTQTLPSLLIHCPLLPATFAQKWGFVIFLSGGAYYLAWILASKWRKWDRLLLERLNVHIDVSRSL